MKAIFSFGLAAATLLLLAGCITVQVPGNSSQGRPAGPGSPNPAAGSTTNCTGGPVLLNEASAKYTLSGKCGQVNVQGQGIVVKLDNAAGVEIRGDRITIDADVIGTLAISGQDNVIDADSIDAVGLRGDRNRIVGDLIRALTINGNDNTVTADTAISGVRNNGSRNSVRVDD